MVALLSQSAVDILTKDALGNSIANQKLNQPYIIDMVDLQKVFLQGLPFQVEVGGDSTISSIASPNRNLPFYNFGGSEDTIKFNISWFAETEELQDVLLKCKWLHSLTKKDSFSGKFHHVKLFFGELFKESTFIITAAPYSIALFTRDKSMLPRLATQELTLKRISDTNPSHADMRKIFY